MNTFFAGESGIPKYISVEFSPPTSEFALLIPVINEGSRIQNQLLRIQELKLAIDIIVTDGGSSDGSIEPDFLKSVGVSSLVKKTSPGFLSTQLRAGFHYCLSKNYQGVITVDGNNKDDVECIPLFVEKLLEGFDYVQGSRFVAGGVAENTPKLRLLAIRFIHSPVTSFAAGFKITDSTNGFRGFSRELLSSSRMGIFREVFQGYELLAYAPIRASQAGFNLVEVPVGRRYPLDAPTPTKINGIVGYLRLMRVLFKAAFRSYNP